MFECPGEKEIPSFTEMQESTVIMVMMPYACDHWVTGVFLAQVLRNMTTRTYC